MSGFITKAACAGRRPAQFAGLAGYQRPELVARLLKERSIARFVVAPMGYGKTSLLVDYAETIFSWLHVFWINCKSPCFIRDLDNASIAQACHETDPTAQLVVFDDLPALDAQRAQAFSDLIDTLISAGCEVVVGCSPQCDLFSSLQRDRLRIGAHDLLLTDEELESSRDLRQSTRSLHDDVPAARRVPMLAWGGPGAVVPFVRGGLKEPMPADILLAMASMLVMRKGTLRDLEAVGPIDFELVIGLAEDYPHLGFDAEVGAFLAPEVSAGKLASALKGSFEALVDRSAFDTREELVSAWADALVGQGQLGCMRACDVVRSLGPQAVRPIWLADNARTLLAHGCMYPGLRLAESVKIPAGDVITREKTICQAYECLCRYTLGDEGGAIRAAKRVAFDGGCSDLPRTCGLLVLSRCANNAVKERADACLDDLSRKLPSTLLPSGSSAPSVSVLLAACWQRALSMENAAELWRALPDLSPSDSLDLIRCLYASWLFTHAAKSLELEGGHALPVDWEALELAEGYVRDLLARLSQGRGVIDHFAVSAGLSLESARVKGVFTKEAPLPTALLLALRHAEVQLASQRGTYLRERDKTDMADEAHADRAEASYDTLVSAAATNAARRIPILKIKMFGRFEVWVGNTRVDCQEFKRKHVRFLLLALAMNLGREVSRDTLARMLWPEASTELARRNFYANWSKLRRALTLADGSCPYLVRHRYGRALEERYVQSDLARHGDICRELLFGRPDFTGWSALYSEIDRDFSNELLPTEDTDDIVVQARAECRSRMTDALVSATQSLIDGNNLQLALWFARKAIGFDETREDAYVALMNAQVANGQRTAAIMTYHKCRRALAEKLGVDPSPETIALYESLIDAK